MKKIYTLKHTVLFVSIFLIFSGALAAVQRRDGHAAVTSRARTDWRALIQQADAVYYQAPDATAGRTPAQVRALVYVRELYARAAQQSDDPSMRAHAQISLADMYTFGDGGAMDYARARDLYERAAGQLVDMIVNARAHVRLGDMYNLGEGVPVNKVRARSYYTIAATQNVDLESKALAQTLLGNMYYFGEGVPVDYAQARELLLPAAQQQANLEVQAAARDRLAEMDALGV